MASAKGPVAVDPDGRLCEQSGNGWGEQPSWKPILMETPRKDDGAGKARKSTGTHGPKPASEGLTCNEGQVEDLLSEGESTEDEDGEDLQASKPTQ